MRSLVTLTVLAAALAGLAGAASCGSSTARFPPYLCQACSTDADCGGGANRCLDVSGAPACGTDCSSASCPTGYTCANVAGGGRNCIPSEGACSAPVPCGGDCQSGWYCDQASDTCVLIPDAGAPMDTASQYQSDAAPIVPTTAVSIIVEPGDSANGLVNAITGATTSVHMTMYILSSTKIINALISAKSAGREVKVILNQTFPTGTSTSNNAVFTQLQGAGIAVKWASSAFTLTHEKCVIIDGKTAWIMTMNATASSPTDNREYLAVDTDPDDVAEAEAIFQADFVPTAITPSGKLLVSPTNSRDRLVALIATAKSTIDMEAETLSDYLVVQYLGSARSRGVAVKIVLSDGTPSTSQSQAVTQLKNAGAQLVTVSSPYIHAKSIVVDGSMAYVGSINFTTASLMYNRELGVIFATASEVQKVLTTTRTDFANGTAL